MKIASWLFVLMTAASLAPIAIQARASQSTAGPRGASGKASKQPAPRLASDCSPGGTSLKVLARDLRAKYPRAEDFIPALDRAAGIDSSFADSHTTTSIVETDDLLIRAIFPYQSFRHDVQEALRKQEPIEAVPVPTAVAIRVSPSTINAPDIIKVVLERDGKVVPPLASTLKPTVMTTRIGTKKLIHAGTVMYACSALDADAEVRVTAIPEVGTNLVVRLPFDHLLMFSAKRDALSFSLVGKKESDVEARLGKPSQVDGHRWVYNVEGGVVRVYFNDLGVVSTVEPTTYDLRGFKTVEPRPVAAINKAAEPARGGPTAAPAPPDTQPPPAAPPPPSPLLGLTTEQMTARLGRPSFATGGVWSYDGPSGTLRVSFTNGRVSSVKPDGYDLTTLAPGSTPPASRPKPSAPPKPPPGAIAQCGDGQFVFVATDSKVCAGHGDVAVWFVKPKEH